MNTVIDQVHGARWSAYHGDCVALATQVPDNSVDFSVYSPPFSSLYIYSESEADMGNTTGDDEFIEQYRYLVREKFRATRPGRLSAVHIKDQVYYQTSSEDGSSGVRPLSDKVTAVHLEEGWNLARRITIASFCRVGMPEYLLVFRKWPKTDAEAALCVPVVHSRSDAPLPIWQELASPIWPAASLAWNYDGPISIDGRGEDCRAITDKGRSGGGDFDLPATDTLNVRQARDPEAEKHLCPMPLNIASRAIFLWSNEGDSVWSPFGGIGSEGVCALRMGRRFFATELNPVYFGYMVGHLTSASAEGRQADMFAEMAL